MKIESKLFNRFVKFAGRNLEPKSSLDLKTGETIRVGEKQWALAGWIMRSTSLDLNLREVKDGKVQEK